MNFIHTSHQLWWFSLTRVVYSGKVPVGLQPRAGLQLRVRQRERGRAPPARPSLSPRSRPTLNRGGQRKKTNPLSKHPLSVSLSDYLEIYWNPVWVNQSDSSCIFDLE